MTDKQLAHVVGAPSSVVNCQNPPFTAPQLRRLIQKKRKKEEENLAPKSHVATFKMANLNGSPQSNLCCDKVFRLWHSTQRTCANNKLLPRAHRLKGTDGKWCRTVMILHFVTLLLLLLQQFSETLQYHYNHSTCSVLMWRVNLRSCSDAVVFFSFSSFPPGLGVFFFFFGAFVAVAAWDCRLKQV